MTQKKKPSAAKRTNGGGKPAKGRSERTEVREGSDASPTADAAAPTSSPKTTEGLEGAMRALELALDRKALEPVLLDVRDLCSFCNYQLVLSGRSDRQVDAIADGINIGLKAEGLRPIGSEGARTGQWALLDYGDFVVHVFLHAAREHYDLEGLWSDAPRIPLDVPDEAKAPPGADGYDAGAPAFGEASR